MLCWISKPIRISFNRGPSCENFWQIRLKLAQYILKKTTIWRHVSLVVNTFRSFPHSWLITRLVTRVTRRVALVEQGLLILPENLSSSVFNGVRVTRSLIVCVMFCRSLFVLFILAIVLSIYGFWLLLRYRQTILHTDYDEHSYKTCCRKW